MKKSIVLLLLFLLWNSLFLLSQQEKYYKIKISSFDDALLQKIARIGISFEGAFIDKDKNSLDIFINDYERKALDGLLINYSIIISDVEKWNAQRLHEGVKTFKKTNEDMPKGFKYGSISGYPSITEYIKMLDSMNIMYPNLASKKESIEKTYENRDIYLIRISNFSKTDTNKRKVLYTGLHHAREPMSIMVNLYFMFYLLENYGKDPLITYLLDSRELFFIPMVNPDGYDYNNKSDPDGGGMWRKNRHIYRYTLFGGVDLNRNYGYMWGYDNIGSDSTELGDTYRGPSAFSEKETQAIRDLCINNKFVFALNFHCYGNYIVVPWGFTNRETPDAVTYLTYTKMITNFNSYFAGTGYQTVGYPVNGDSDDWMYGEQKQKNKIIAMTVEMGQNYDGFWAQKDRILPIAKENLEPCVLLAKAAGPFPEFQLISKDSIADLSDIANIKFRVQNIGMEKAENITITIKTNTDSLISNVRERKISSLNNMEKSDTLNFSLSWKNVPQYFSKAAFTISTECNGLSLSRSFNIMYRTIPVIYSQFSLKQSMNNIILSWETSTEKDNKRFYIERKENNGSFILIDSVSGNGTSKNINNYTYQDNLKKNASYTYRIKTIDSLGYGNFSTEKKINFVLGAKDNTSIGSYSLYQNYPNPFNPSTVISYSVEAHGLAPVQIKVYDILGREVKTLINEFRPAGIHKVEFDGKSLSGGIYYYEIKAGNFHDVKKMIYLK